MQGKRKASLVVVGISDYVSLQKLDFCKKDGQEVYEILSSLGYEISENNKLIGEVKGEKVKEKKKKLVPCWLCAS
jgi:outer membrane protease